MEIVERVAVVNEIQELLSLLLLILVVQSESTE